MFDAKLISVTYPVGQVNFSTPEELLVYIARVSNPSNQENFKTGPGLLRYCMRNQHWSVFEMVDVTMEIKTTRDIGRQILRHWSFNFQEFSQRYAEVKTDDFEYREARMQDSKNRQNSIETADPDLILEWCGYQEKVADVAEEAYRWAIEKGIAKEQARVVLPEGMTPSTMYMKGNLRNWIHYVDLRSGNGTQKEHREIAEKIRVILMKEFEFLAEYWSEE